MIVSVWEREGVNEGRRKRKGGGTRCMRFSESVLSTGLIVNKCLVLEQQAPLSSVASCYWRFTNYVCQKGHAVLQEFVVERRE